MSNSVGSGNAQDKAAVVVDDVQRKAVAAIKCFELALEVGLPEFVAVLAAGALPWLAFARFLWVNAAIAPLQHTGIVGIALPVMFAGNHTIPRQKSHNTVGANNHLPMQRPNRKRRVSIACRQETPVIKHNNDGYHATVAGE